MRFTEEIFQEYKRFVDEQRHLDFHKEKDTLAGNERLPFWGEMDFVAFNRLSNTLSWLDKFNNPGRIRAGEAIPVKPTAAEIMEVAQRILESGEDFRVDAHQYAAGELKKSLQKHATKVIKCGSYYKELAATGFFDDKKLPGIERKQAIEKEECPS